MSDNDSTITVTRGSREERAQQKQSSSRRQSRSSGLGVPGPGALVTGVVRGVQNAWWAGLGAFAAARDAGAQVFDALVAEDKSWEQARRERTEKTAQQVQQLAEESDAVQVVEKRVRDEVNAALRRVGVPDRDEVDALREQIDALSEQIEQLQGAVSESQAGETE